MNKFRDTGNFKVTGTPWSHTARITEVPLYHLLGVREPNDGVTLLVTCVTCGRI